MSNFAVIGDPIGHSLSPAIHNRNFESLGLQHSYRALLVKQSELHDIRNTSRSHELSGFNVTIPHKVEIMQYLDYIDDDAAHIGAVNTVQISDGTFTGYNTDVSGYKEAYTDHFGDSTRKVLIIGAGGAAKAVHRAHRNLGDDVFVYARRKASFERFITDDFTPLMQLSEEETFDVIINATPVGLKDENLVDELTLPESLFTEDTIGIDLIYQPVKTKFLQHFNEDKIMNGLPMLVNQAMHAFEIWTGTAGDYETVNRTLAEHFGG